MASQEWSVYIIECNNKSLYTGISNDVERRFNNHRKKRGALFTKIFGVKRILYTESIGTRSDALKREFEIKKWPRKKKLELIGKKKKSKRKLEGGNR